MEEFVDEDVYKQLTSSHEGRTAFDSGTVDGPSQGTNDYVQTSTLFKANSKLTSRLGEPEAYAV